jgi:hypothetical protein
VATLYASIVAHTPVLPAAGESIVVTARPDPDDFPHKLVVSIDPATSYSTVTMTDDAGGDAVAGDGYSATIPPTCRHAGGILCAGGGQWFPSYQFVSNDARPMSASCVSAIRRRRSAAFTASGSRKAPSIRGSTAGAGQ